MNMTEYGKTIRKCRYEASLSRKRIDKARRYLRQIETLKYPGMSVMNKEKIKEHVDFWSEELSEQTDKLNKMTERIEYCTKALDRLVQTM